MTWSTRLRYGVHEGDPEHSQTLADLKSRITTAAAADDFADYRIANVSGLTQYYRDIGAYGDITPDDGSTETFTPSQPPSVAGVRDRDGGDEREHEPGDWCTTAKRCWRAKMRWGARRH